MQPAALFVDYWRGAGHEEGRLWRGTAQVADLVQLVGRFLGEAQTREAFAAEARGRLTALAVANAIARIDGAVRDREARSSFRALARLGRARGRSAPK
jgi:hypothetical protein